MLGDSDAQTHGRGCHRYPPYGNRGYLPVADLTEDPGDGNQRRHRQCERFEGVPEILPSSAQPTSEPNAVGHRQHQNVRGRATT